MSSTEALRRGLKLSIFSREQWGSWPTARLAFLCGAIACVAVVYPTATHAADGASPPTIEALGSLNPALPKIPDRTFNVRDFGATGDGKTLDTAAFQKALAKVKAEGGGKLIVPQGTYLILPITLCSNLDLHLEDGAVLQAPSTFTEYGLPEPETLSSQEEVAAKVKMPQPLIYGKDLHDVAISGTGTIDGAGATWWAWSERAMRAQPGRLVYPRPKMVVIEGCERLHVSGVTLRNSPMFHLVPKKVSDLVIEDVKLRAPANGPNTDAIDPGDCNNVLIRRCDIDVGDDDIVIKAGGHDILIEDCAIHHGHGISIGSETANGVHDMLVRRCTFENADNGIRIKSMKGAGGLVERIYYQDIQMKNIKDAILLDLMYVDNNRPNFKGDPNKIPKIKDVEIKNVTIENSRNAGKIRGLPESPIEGIVLRDVTISAATDFDQVNADDVKFENVTRNIKQKD
jgi:polygalacturonase